jgi:hypothetical protein
MFGEEGIFSPKNLFPGKILTLYGIYYNKPNLVDNVINIRIFNKNDPRLAG